MPPECECIDSHHPQPRSPWDAPGEGAEGRLPTSHANCARRRGREQAPTSPGSARRSADTPRRRPVCRSPRASVAVRQAQAACCERTAIPSAPSPSSEGPSRFGCGSGSRRCKGCAARRAALQRCRGRTRGRTGDGGGDQPVAPVTFLRPGTECRSRDKTAGHRVPWRRRRATIGAPNRACPTAAAEGRGRRTGRATGAR